MMWDSSLAVYNTPCECGNVYIGQTVYSNETRLTKNEQHICVGHPAKSAMVEIILNSQCRICPETLSTKAQHMDCIRCEAIKIRLHPYMKRENVMELSRPCPCLIHSLKNQKKTP